PTMCGAGSGAAVGSGGEDVYEIRIKNPKVIVASTDNAITTANTVLYLRTADCTNSMTEIACSDDVSTSDDKSTLTVALDPGVYYLVVDSRDNTTSGNYRLDVHFFVGIGSPCTIGDECGPGLVCRVPKSGTTKVCSKHVCSDGVDDDGDGKADYP